MPRKDPMTGVMVMTTMEFFDSEARREGKGRTAGELLSDFVDDMEKERKDEEERLKDPKYAHDLLMSCIGDENAYRKENGEELLPTDFKVLEVVKATYNFTFRSHTTKLIVKV